MTHKDVKAFDIEHTYVVEFIMELEKNFEFYLANLDDLAKEYDGKYIAIKDCKVLGAYETMVDAVEQTERQGHELGTFIVQKASTDPSAYTANYYNNLIRIGE